MVSRVEMRDHPDVLARLVRVFRLTPAEFIRWCDAHGHLSPQDKAALHTLVQNFPEHRLLPTAAAEP
jgi:hypothetical protein